ncbi:MAG TPA: FAD-dependent monooxygenase, partial [Fimbriimonadaceae bacterium]|nr:FAD-dependent monooxygenase [Fimbriimonadaceae bacterium]
WRLVQAMPGRKPDKPRDDLLREAAALLLGEGPVEIEWMSAFDLHQRSARYYRVERVMLLGDAAHLNSPSGAQGMNAGIQDAHNLAWKLAACLQGADETAFLTSFDEERQDFFWNTVAVESDRYTQWEVFASPGKRRLVAATLSFMAKFKAGRKKIAKSAGMLTHRHEPSELIGDSGGQLLPNAKTSVGRLRQAIGPAGGLLVVSGFGREVKVRDQQISVTEGAAELRALKGRHVVVRPDFVVAYAGNSLAQAQAWWDLIRGASE